MNNKFIKDFGFCFEKDLNSVQTVNVINYITKLTTMSEGDRVSLIKQFLNNCINIESIDIEVISYK